MLARASSDAGTRLRRSKSTSTVHRHAPPDIAPLDPEIAQQHAIAAATAAFLRLQPRESIERKANRSVELGRSKSTASRRSLRSQGSHFPPRTLSIRSVPPQKGTLITSAPRVSIPKAPQTDKIPSFDTTPSSDRPTSSLRPLSAQPLTGLNEYGRPASQPKSHRQSAASSITSQQIRKARSMYYASSVQTGSPVARPPERYLTTPPLVSTNSAMSTAPAAYIPRRGLGSSPLAVPQIPVPVAAGETIDNARDKYLQDFQQRSVKHKPSLFLAPFKRRQERAKDKSKRLSSIIASATPTDYHFTDDATVDITAVSDFMPPQDMKERRSFSDSWKRKIKKVFRRTSNKSPGFPVQQIEASRDYFSNTNPLTHDHCGDIPSPTEETLRTARSRTPALDGGSPHPIRSASRSSSRGSTRSTRSLHSETNVSHLSASRITSWGTSASGETLTQRAMKRLTVIHEAKDSIGSVTERSASVSTHRKSLPHTFTAFKDPMHLESLAEEAATPPVDPKRVFSALLREIDASKSTQPSIAQPSRTPGAESDVFESSKTKESHFPIAEVHSSPSKDQNTPASSEQESLGPRPGSVTMRSVLGKKSSFRSFGQAIRSTIRTVTPGEQRCPLNVDELHDSQNGSELASPSASSSDQEGRTAMFKKFRLSKKRSAIVHPDESIETCTPTAEQVDLRVARARNRWQTPLNESATPQIPLPDQPYTVAKFSKRSSLDKAEAVSELQTSTHSPALQMPKSFETPMSPSIYSRNTDGASILPTDSMLSFNGTHDHDRTDQGGSAVILTSQSVRSYVIGTPSPKRPISTRSSRDWKAWLSHEVSAIETVSQEDVTINERYNTPSRNHKREVAQTVRSSQTGSDETTFTVRGSLDIATPRARPFVLSLSNLEQQLDESSVSQEHSILVEAVTSGPAVCPEILRDSIRSHSCELEGELEHEQRPTASPPNVREDRPMSTPSSRSSAPQPPLGTPSSARMNDRFPFLNTGRRSSSNNSRASRLSKSPTGSGGSSLKETKGSSGSQAVYSDLSSPSMSSTTAVVYDPPPKVAGDPQKSKENLAPYSIEGHQKISISPVGLISRPKSLQPLPSSVLHRASPNIANYTADATNASQSKRTSAQSEAVVARPSLRVTIRPLSPEKLSRRPRSAFDLRSSPSPRLASEICRSALRSKTSSRLSTHGHESKSSTRTPVRDTQDTHQRDGSVTPGQQMAERFLKERKSAAVLERGVRKSTGRLVREDTPAFL